MGQRKQAGHDGLMQQQDPVKRAITYAKRCIDHLGYIATAEISEEVFEKARQRMHLAFSQASSPELYRCSQNSIGLAIACSALSGLMPGGPRPDVWLIPRNRECCWQISARGWQRKARENGAELRGEIVRKSDPVFRITKGLTPTLEHEADIDAAHGWESIRGAYVVVMRPGRPSSFAYLTREEIAKRRKKAQTDKFWAEWPEEMALKTMYSYAGAREMFPMDERGRVIAELDVQIADVGPSGLSQPQKLLAGAPELIEAPMPEVHIADSNFLDEEEQAAIEAEERVMAAE